MSRGGAAQTIFKGGIIVKSQKTSFICKCCGKEEDFPSIATFEARYGSRYDGETMVLEICGKCVDMLFDARNPEKVERMWEEMGN